MKKNAFFTFCLACVPGAGQMYVGYMHRGLSIMTAFAGILAFSSFFRISAISIFLPVIWAYSFFDAWNIRNRTPEECEKHPDDYILHLSDITNNENIKLTLQKRNKLIGGLCIALGAYMLLDSVLEPVFERLGFYWLQNILYYIPSIAVALLIIMLGLWLIKGHAPTETEDTYTQFDAPKEIANDTDITKQ